MIKIEIIMGLIRILAVGAAVAYGINYLTKKRPDGRSMMDDIKDKAPEWMEKAKPYMEKAQPYADRLKDQFNKATQSGGL